MIQMLTNSHLPHITAGVIDLKTVYVMDTQDFYNGYGDLYEADKTTFKYEMYLPTIGTNYTLYHDINYGSTQTFWNDIVLTDITPIEQGGVSDTWVDNTGWDGHKKVKVQYTWSNLGKKDIIIPGDPSSLKFVVETDTETATVSLIHDYDNEYDLTTTQTVKEVKDAYFTEKNPDVIHYYTDDNGDEQADNKGKYNSASIYWKNYHRENNDAPQKEFYTTKTRLTVTMYSRNNYQFLMSDNINTINRYDFLESVNTMREQRLYAKQKLPTYEYSDLAATDDTTRWLFYDYTITEHANNIYQYDMFFLYKPDTWKSWYGVELGEYKQIDFYNVLLVPMFNVY